MFNLSIIPFMYYDYNILYVGIFGSAFIINLILANDIYFLYKHSNTNLILYPQFFPSFRYPLYNISQLCVFTMLACSITICYDYWNYNINNNIYKTFALTGLSIILSYALFVVTIGILSLLLCNTINFINEKIDNYYNGYSLFYSNKQSTNTICWLCQTPLLKNQKIALLKCSCNENYHQQCIDKYLNIYNNVCKKGHKIQKYNHIL
jgi:hypothetical protein